MHIAQQIRSTLNLISEDTDAAREQLRLESLQAIVNQSNAILKLALHSLKKANTQQKQPAPPKVKKVKPPSQTSAKPKPIKPIPMIKT
jgi:hypothetical protein